MNLGLETRVIDVTVGELLDKIKETVRNEVQSNKTEDKEPEDEYVYGIEGLADFLHCGKSKAQKLSSSGVIDSAIFRFGRNIMFNKKEVIKKIQENENKKRRNIV